MKKLIIILFITSFAYASDRSDKNLLAANLFAYSVIVQQDILKAQENPELKLNADGIVLIEHALNDDSFIKDVCQVDKTTEKECLDSPLGLPKELLGLKNSINLYNRDCVGCQKDNRALYLRMAYSDVIQVKYFIEQYLKYLKYINYPTNN